MNIEFACLHRKTGVSRSIGNDLYAYPLAAASTGYGVNGLNQYTAAVGGGAATQQRRHSGQ